jgi:hypothetical protein
MKILVEYHLSEFSVNILVNRFARWCCGANVHNMCTCSLHFEMQLPSESVDTSMFEDSFINGGSENYSDTASMNSCSRTVSSYKIVEEEVAASEVTSQTMYGFI